MKKFLFIGSALVLLFVVGFIVWPKSGSTPQEQNRESAKPLDEKQLKGVSLSPKSLTAEDFSGFWKEAASIGNTVGWYGSIAEVTKKNGAAYVVVQLCKNYDLTPLIVIQFYDRKDGKTFPEMEDSRKQETINALKDFVSTTGIKYLGIGIEVNMLYDTNKVAFGKYVTQYNEITKAVKEVSPNVKIFPIFQLEQMKGLRGGLFGGKNEPEKHNWALLSQFENADMIGLTTYPELIYKTPGEIPAEYYKEITTKTQKPVIFTEVGWSYAPMVAGWDSTPAMQKEFIIRFKNDMKEVKPVGTIWSFLYDPPGISVPFKTMGLRSGSDVSKSESENEWSRD